MTDDNMRERSEYYYRGLCEIREIYCNMEGFEPETAAEGYVLQEIKKMYDTAVEFIGNTRASPPPKEHEIMTPDREKALEALNKEHNLRDGITISARELMGEEDYRLVLGDAPNREDVAGEQPLLSSPSPSEPTHEDRKVALYEFDGSLSTGGFIEYQNCWAFDGSLSMASIETIRASLTQRDPAVLVDGLKYAKEMLIWGHGSMKEKTTSAIEIMDKAIAEWKGGEK